MASPPGSGTAINDSPPGSPHPHPPAHPPAIVVDQPGEKADYNKPVQMTGDRRPSDPSDFTERKTSLIVGDRAKLFEEVPPVPRKWEKDFFICNGIMAIGFILELIAIIVIVYSSSAELHNIIGPTRKQQ